MIYEIKSPKSSLRHNILIVFFLVLAVGGVTSNIAFHNILQAVLSKETLDKSVVEDVGRYFTIIWTGLTIAGILVVLLIAVFLSNTITRPIKKLMSGMIDIAGGKWATRIDFVSQDELGQLASGFNIMAEQVESALQKVEVAKEYTDNIVVTVPSILIVLSNHSKVLSANRAFGRLREKFPSLTLGQFIVPLEDDIRKNLETGETINKEIILIPEGSETSLIFSTVVTQIGSEEEEQKEEKARVLLTITDITDRKKIEDTLTRAKIEWEMTFDHANELIILVDRELNIIRCNKSFAEFSRLPIDELIGCKCYEFLSPSDTKQFEHFKELMLKGEPMTRTDIKTKDGNWFYVSTCPVKDENRGFLHTVIIATDIKELKDTHQRLTKSEKELKKRLRELEKFYDLAIGRELKMKELKEEIKQLQIELSKYRGDGENEG